MVFESLFGWDMGNTTDNSAKTPSTENNQNAENSEKQEIPITDKAEAISFGYGEMGKIMRNDGHQIDLKLIGNINYRVGAWIRVFLPSFNEDSMMFISKAQQEAGADSEWITSLTLVDYPPSLGKGKSNTSDGSAGSEGSSDSSGGNDSESDSDGSESSSLWTRIAKLVNDRYPASNNPNKWIGELVDAPTTWKDIAVIVNAMGGDSEKQNKMISDVLKAKKELGSSSASYQKSKIGYNKKASAPQNTLKPSKSQSSTKGYDKKLNRFK